MDQSKKNASLQRARLVLPLFLGGVVIAAVGFTMREITPRDVSASSVRDEIVNAIESDGYVGPFLMQAESFDGESSEFINFHAETDDLMIGARRAVLEINPATDTIQFVLYEATIVSVPERAGETQVVSRERYILGPFDWKLDIVEDTQRDAVRIVPD